MDYSRFVGYFEISEKAENVFDKNYSIIPDSVKSEDSNIYLFDSFLKESERLFLIKEQSKNKRIPVGIDGIVSNYDTNTIAHSYRSTVYNKEMAEILFGRINPFLSNMISPYDDLKSNFRPVGLNPSFRFIEYNNNGYLIPHYDFPYKENENKLTLMSLVLYLNTIKVGGETRFIEDKRINDYSDWDRKAVDSEVLSSVNPLAGSALLFPHQLLHESTPSSEAKMIIRTDIMFERII